MEKQVYQASPERIVSDRLWASRSPANLIEDFGHLRHDTGAGEVGVSAGWIRFHLWPAQREALGLIHREKQSIILKARQLGLTWLVLGYCLWLLLYRAGATVLLFSSREDEAKELLLRLRGMYDRLPPWLQLGGTEGRDNTTGWELPNGSRALCFPTSAGFSYTASLVVIDEADRIGEGTTDKTTGKRHLGWLLDAVKPTMDAGGQLVLLSTADKSRPESPFKQIYRAARAGKTSYSPLFLPWSARPERTMAWREQQVRDSLAETGSLDRVDEQYPATDIEALAPRSLDKRFPGEWLAGCYCEQGPCDVPDNFTPPPPAVPGLTLYAYPEPNRRYAGGIDPAEGNPTSDESAAVWADVQTGEDVALLAGRFEPVVFADYVAQVSAWFGRAPVLVERNNHGHTVLAALDGSGIERLSGSDGKPGWLQTTRGKADLWSLLAEKARAGGFLCHDFTTLCQLQSIDGSTLRAPGGMHDDRAVARALCAIACSKPVNVMPFRPFSCG